MVVCVIEQLTQQVSTAAEGVNCCWFYTYLIQSWRCFESSWFSPATLETDVVPTHTPHGAKGLMSVSRYTCAHLFFFLSLSVPGTSPSLAYASSLSSFIPCRTHVDLTRFVRRRQRMAVNGWWAAYSPAASETSFGHAWYEQVLNTKPSTRTSLSVSLCPHIFQERTCFNSFGSFSLVTRKLTRQVSVEATADGRDLGLDSPLSVMGMMDSYTSFTILVPGESIRCRLVRGRR